MNVYLTVEILQGDVTSVTAHLSEGSALIAEALWLKEMLIPTPEDREASAQIGTEFRIQECQLLP